MLRTRPSLGIVVLALLAVACTTSSGGSAGPTLGIPSTVPSGPATAAPTATSTIGPAGGTPSSPAGPASPLPSVAATVEPTPRPSAGETAVPPESVAPLAGEPCGPDGAWVATEGYGLTCVDAQGWHVYTEASGPILSDRVQDIATCEDGSTWIAFPAGLMVTDGGNWFDRSDLLGGKSPDHLACDPKGGIWFGAYGGVGHLGRTGELTWYEASELGTGKYVASVKGLAVARDGTVWASTTNSVASFDGRRWTSWEQGKGFSKLYYFEEIAVAGDGHPWVGATEGVLTFNGTSWTAHLRDQLFQSQHLASDTKGRIWVGTYARGLSLWNGSTWKTWTRANSGLSSDYTHSVAVDAKGRVWLGTEWGLDVMAGSTWTAYHMDTSPLPDNQVGPIAVVGGGPPLPDLVTTETGALSGTVLQNGIPQKGLTIEACVEFLGTLYSGETPCSGQPLVKSATTAADGTFTIRDLPVGRYSLAIRKADGAWVRLTDGWKIGDRETLVEAGATTDLGELDVGSAS